MNTEQFLDTPIEFCKGIGPKKAEVLKTELSIFRFEDFINYFPYRWIDRTKVHKISELNSEMAHIQIRGFVKSMNMVGKGRGQRLVVVFADDTGSIELVWFQGIKWIKDLLKTGVEYLVFGKPSEFNGKINLNHPELDIVSEQSIKKSNFLMPIYHTTDKMKKVGLDSKGIHKAMVNLLNAAKDVLGENLNEEVIQAYKLIPRFQAYLGIHYPKDNDILQKAQFRLKFEEFFFIQLKLLLKNQVSKKQMRGYKVESLNPMFNHFYEQYLPFELTNAQKKVLKEIRRDLASGAQMNRLLQGDVGSGKTIVAVLTMLMLIGEGMQACLMAPTEILANQHFESIKNLLEPAGIPVALLTGSTKAAERQLIHEALINGEIKVLIGTHALIEQKVQYHRLGLAVIDEQHRFGVAQRAKLWSKNTEVYPHILVMTATPIPRTLAMTLYGDLDVSVIDELPPGRKPIKTIHRYESSRYKVYEFLRTELQKGRQVYIVYPLINESAALDYKHLEEGYEQICHYFKEYKVAKVHGQMKSAEKDAEMQRFVSGEAQIMVATTVIEVGVNVPNASIMLIENAERYGLSQLHQLRGRVGRGADQSYCILMTDVKLSSNTKVRIKTMTDTNDGFVISEVDLKLRGPGEIEGLKQSGNLNLKIADLAKDQNILNIARNTAKSIIEKDRLLQSKSNLVLINELKRLESKKTQWSKVS